ncbi:MAG: hypothetical protein RL113_141 [Pseudomonadota bacterium]|jgi:hypothetical protein
MKKFLLSILLVLVVLGGLFMYALYTEGAFDARVAVDQEAKPFTATMKCETGKCGGAMKEDMSAKCETGKCETGKCDMGK